jgi:RNA polymerase sporulation-specific sigma factor
MAQNSEYFNCTDEQLAALAVNNPEAASELTARMFPSIRSLAMSINSRIWDDLFQEGLLGMLSAIGGYDERRGSFKTYALTCARNRMLSTVKQNSLLGGEEDRTAELADSADVDFERRERFYELYEAIDRVLTKNERECMECYMKGYSYRETAQRLGISIKSVDNAMQRARKKLRDEFK